VKLLLGDWRSVRRTYFERKTMKRLAYAVAAIAIGTLWMTAGCGSGHADSPRPPTAGATASAQDTKPPAHPTVNRPVPTTTPRVAPKADPLCPKKGVPVAGLLRAVRVGHHATYDRVVFEFCGKSVPQHNVGYVVGKVHMDASDLIVPLRGRAFVRVVFQGGTIDTARYAPDPDTAPRYSGPLRLTPTYALLKELAFAGDFEAVLSFGIGVDHVVGLHVQTLASPPRLVVDFRLP
jgi:hypothetical protein